MKLGKWVLGAAVAGLWLGSAQAGTLPAAMAPPIDVFGIESVQYYYGPPRDRYEPRYDDRRRDQYDGPGPGHYGDRNARRNYDGPRQRADTAKAPNYRGAPPARNGVVPIPRRPVAPPNVYTKDQVREWNRRNGL
jgi:hypothetical protein